MTEIKQDDLKMLSEEKWENDFRIKFTYWIAQSNELKSVESTEDIIDFIKSLLNKKLEQQRQKDREEFVKDIKLAFIQDNRVETNEFIDLAMAMQIQAKMDHLKMKHFLDKYLG